MSVEAMAWAFKQKINDAQTKLVLLALCDHADENGLCWPSQERLADKAACSLDTAQRRLQRLETLGFITVRRRRRQTSIYRISLYKNALKPQHQRYQENAPDDAIIDEMLNPQNDVLEPQTPVLETAAGAALTINTNHQLEPSLFASYEAKQPRRKKRAQIPEDWQPDDKGILFARGLGFAEEKIRQLVVACRDYHLKHGTLIAGSIGLAATWRTWCNNEVKFTEERQARYGGKIGGSKKWEDVVFAGVRGATAEMARERDDRRTDETISERGRSGFERGGTTTPRIEDHRH